MKEPSPPPNGNPQLYNVLWAREQDLDQIIAPDDPGAVFCRCGQPRLLTESRLGLVCTTCDSPAPSGLVAPGP